MTGPMLIGCWRVSCASCRARASRPERLAHRRAAEVSGYRVGIDTHQQALAEFGLPRELAGAIDGPAAVNRFNPARHRLARVARVDALLRRRGLLAVIGVRLIPVLPFTAINYAAGLTAVRTRDYVIGTAVGIVPGTAAFVALGSYGTEPTSWPFVAAIGALVVLSAGGTALARRARRAARQSRRRPCASRRWAEDL